MGWFWADSETTAPVSQTRDDTSISKCPVKHDSYFNKRPVDKPAESTSKCPVKHDSSSSQGWFGWSSKLNPLNMMPELSSQKAPGQKLDLPTERTMSSIPKGTTDSEGVWEYPSPQQMFNAMLRKGGGEIPEDAVESMVDWHNFLNEGAWKEILEWEQPYTDKSQKEPRLLKFQGRPEEMSPRARMIQWLGKVFPATYGAPPPFDRHDWTVLRGEPDSDEWKQVRYVIDYYAGPDDDDGMPSFILDVRPALDSVSSTVDRLHKAYGSTWDKAMGRSGPSNN
ncbi:holocytochrome-c synthase [Trichomonascus vanleenenianus]|uniref:holocytochrome c synthase CYC3 n=1 Tax=Trichomonascus vanleenenianus TaxID=2268995 RepID=UPI003ECB10C1